jgi:hypothetical protein
MQQRNTGELCRINLCPFEMDGVLTSAGGSAWTMQASCASLPSPEWTQPLSTSISGASAQQNGLASQELMWVDVGGRVCTQATALVQRLACPQFGAQDCYLAAFSYLNLSYRIRQWEDSELYVWKDAAGNDDVTY